MRNLLLLIISVLFLGNQVSFGQTKKMSCDEALQTLGKDKMLQLYWTDKLATFLLQHPEKEPYRKDSIPWGNTQIKSCYYAISTSLGTFALIVYDKAYDIACDEDGSVSLFTRFNARKDWTTLLHDSRIVREAYFKYSKEKEFEPSQQELDTLCMKLTH